MEGLSIWRSGMSPRWGLLGRGRILSRWGRVCKRANDCLDIIILRSSQPHHSAQNRHPPYSTSRTSCSIFLRRFIGLRPTPVSSSKSSDFITSGEIKTCYQYNGNIPPRFEGANAAAEPAAAARTASFIIVGVGLGWENWQRFDISKTKSRLKGKPVRR